ncbi:MAG: hypothetical protein ACHREM_16590, partial [Polyangiales bacterium]
MSGESKGHKNKHEDAPASQLPGTVRTGDEVAARAAPVSPTTLNADQRRALDGLRGLARSAERRMRFARAAELFVSTLAASLLLGAIVLAATKTGMLREIVARRWMIGLAVAPMVAAIVGWVRGLPPLAGAIALDRDAGLKDRIATALSFGAITEDAAHAAEVTPLMIAAIEDGLGLSTKASPSRAVRVPVPRDLVAVLALASVVAVIASLEVRKHIQAAQSPTIDALEVSSDDIDAMADFARQMEDHAHSPEMQAAVQEFNQLIEELRNKHIDRNEAFRRMAELDLKLQRQSELDRKALDEAMKKLGEELKKNDLSRDIGAALTKGDKKEAEKKLKELATKLRDGKQKISDEQKKALAEALKKASQRDREKALAEMKAARDKVSAELEKMRADKEKAGGKESAEQERDRKTKERELDRLDREEKALASGDRQLAKLDRDLDQAADD